MEMEMGMEMGMGMGMEMGMEMEMKRAVESMRISKSNGHKLRGAHSARVGVRALELGDTKFAAV